VIVSLKNLLLTESLDYYLNLSPTSLQTGEPAIKYVFTNWLSRQHLFYGTYERKVSIVALCKLFEYGVTSKDVRLTSVMLKEPVIAQPSQTRTTRSQTSNVQQWKDVSILVKIFKLLLNELSNLKEMKNADDDQEDGDSSSNEEESFCEGNTSGKNFAAYMLDFEEDDESTNDDDKQMMAELMQDPIFQTDMEENLTKFIQNFTCDENFKMFFEQLNDAEKELLQSLAMK
jgi:importin-9